MSAGNHIRGPSYHAPKEHICRFCNAKVTTRNGLKKHYVTQHHMQLRHGDDTPTAILPGMLPIMLQKVRAGQRHRAAPPVPSGDGTLLDTATGGRLVTPPLPPPAPQGVSRVLPADLFARLVLLPRRVC